MQTFIPFFKSSLLLFLATDADVKNESLSLVQQLGVHMTVRYVTGKGRSRVFLEFFNLPDTCLVVFNS